VKNRILKFLELVTESHETDDQELNDLLLDLKDELISYELHKGYFSKQALDRGQQGEKIMGILNNNPIYEDDKYCFCIDISLEQIQDSLKLGDRFGRKSLIKDKKIFIIFRELYQISERYDNCFLLINPTPHRPAIYLFILLDTEVDTGTTKLLQIYKEIQSRNSSAKSDFSNDTTVRLQDDKIVISSKIFSRTSTHEVGVTTNYDNTYGYTDRKFRRLIRGIDLTDFKIEKTEEDGTYAHTKNIINTISRK
jgi:hypothetical protein